MNRNQARKRFKAIQSEFQLFDCGREPQRVRLLEEAWITNLRRDEVDSASGFAAHSDVPFDAQLRTVITALWAAVAEIERNSTASAMDIVAEAIAMTQWVEAHMRDHEPPTA